MPQKPGVLNYFVFLHQNTNTADGGAQTHTYSVDILEVLLNQFTEKKLSETFANILMYLMFLLPMSGGHIIVLILSPEEESNTFCTAPVGSSNL